MSELVPAPNPQDPNDPMYQFIDTQPASAYPNNPDSSLSHFTVRQFTPENITQAYPPVVTKTAHGLINGQAIRATKFISIPFALATGMQQLNNQLFYVQGVTINTFYLADRNTQPIDGRNFTPYIQGGQFTVTGQDLPIVNPSRFPPPGIPVP
jgi:hypothetical protein